MSAGAKDNTGRRVEALEISAALKSVRVDRDTLLDISNLATGTFAPLKGFLCAKDYFSVVNHMHLSDQQPWAMPITLELPEDKRLELSKEKEICLKSQDGSEVAILTVEDIYQVGPLADTKKVYGTSDMDHPGVKKELSRSRFRVGGSLKMLALDLDDYGGYVYTPDQTRELFRKKQWKTVVGFQTRNPVHRAHEHLQRLGLKAADGLFINPLIGWKKTGDFSSKAIIRAYQHMIEKFYTPDKVCFGIFRTAMRYAGPREAVFHAQVRRNYGCTHFIVGRDHAGVGNYYGKYAAHNICDQFNNLGIEILKMPGPYFCKRCNDVTTEGSCSHDQSSRIEINGTLIRKMIGEGKYPPAEMIRGEIAEILLNLHKDGEAFNQKDQE